jgi:DNA-binding CsgD family transcriptional regulator
MCSAFRTYVEQLESACTEDQLRSAIAAVAAKLDVPTFAYVALPRRRNLPLRLISNYPPLWMNHYVARGYQNCDPVVGHLGLASCAFDWSAEFAGDNEAAQRFFSEAHEFGICFGHTIPIHNRRGPVAAVTFATDRRWPAFCASLARNADTLELIAIYFHAFFCRKVGVLSDIHLTERERQCLFWASHGKSARDIGGILELSERTVKFHLHNVRKKLNVATTIQAAVAYERARLGRLD